MPNIIKAGRIIRTSRNLRGVLDYARVSPVVRVETCRVANDEGTMRVFFKDGAECRCNFASHAVMTAWLKARRTWASAKHVSYAGEADAKKDIVARQTCPAHCTHGKGFNCGQCWPRAH